MSTIYITGHKSPDLDSVAAAIAYQYFKEKIDGANTYVAAAAGELNKETTYLLDKYGFAKPETVASVSGQDVILVDHNESQQSPDDIKAANILEIIDHHQLDFCYHTPIRIIIEPIGSSCSVIFKMFKAGGVAVPQNLAALMLGAVLVDTVITKSPTCTDEDRGIIAELAGIAGISDWEQFGMGIFKVRSSVSELADADIITSDFKDFDINGKKFGIGQVETVDMADFDNRQASLMTALQEKKLEGGYHSVILFITNILKEDSLFLVASEEPDRIASAFDATLSNNSFSAKVMSRKKEVAPKLIAAFKG